MPPSGRRNSTLPLSHGEAVRFHGSISSASPSRARAGLAVEASVSPGAVLITPSRGSPTTVVVLALPQPSIRCANVDMRRRNLAGSSTGAQVAKLARSLTLMWLSCSRASRRNLKARRRSALPGNIARKLAPMSFNCIADGPQPSMTTAARHGMRSSPTVAELDKRPDVFGAEVHVGAAIGVIAKIDSLPATRHCVAIEQLLGERRP